MTLLETPRESLLIDAGILFPDDDFCGLNYLIPNLEALNPQTLTDIIITHGHEDHIGAMVHLIHHIPHIRIWAPPFAAALLEKKFAEHVISHEIFLYQENHIFRFTGLEIHPIHVNHSIPHTFGLLIKDLQRRLSCFYVSDFKVDPRTPYEAPINLEKLRKLSHDSSLRYLLVDSTNILNKGKTPSEADMVAPLQTLMQKAQGRIFITFFPSNIHRLQTIIEIAFRLKKKILYLGRSFHFYSQVAHSLDLLRFFQETLITEKEVTGQEKNLIVLLSGCQGDFKGSLKRVVYQEHPLLRLGPQDLVIFSSRTIPGNEVRMGKIYNRICESGAEIICSEEAPVHSSGHPGQEDLKILFESFRPTHITPIHGETFFLARHLKFIQEQYPHIKGILMTNHQSLTIGQNLEIEMGQMEPLEPVFIHGKGIPIEKMALQKRRKMAMNGMVHISLVKSNAQKMKVTFLGLPLFLETWEEKFLLHLQTHWENYLKDKEEGFQKQEMALAARKFLFPLLGYKPLIVVHTL